MMLYRVVVLSCLTKHLLDAFILFLSQLEKQRAFLYMFFLRRAEGPNQTQVV